MAVQKQRVTEDRPRPEDADLVRPLHRRLAVAAQHLVHLGDALGNMHRQGQAAVGHFTGMRVWLKAAK
jgi:hypothetical protein